MQLANSGRLIKGDSIVSEGLNVTNCYIAEEALLPPALPRDVPVRSGPAVSGSVHGLLVFWDLSPQSLLVPVSPLCESVAEMFLPWGWHNPYQGAWLEESSGAGGGFQTHLAP